MTYKVLLVGLGQIGMGYDFDAAFSSDIVATHARAFALHPNFILVGGVDSNAHLCAKFSGKYGPEANPNLVEMLVKTQPDIVVIATPTRFHGDAVQKALLHASPRLILCEKPLAYEQEEAQAMVDACKRRSCQLFVNYLRRVDAGVLDVKQRVMDGRIATPIKGVAWYTKGLMHNGSHFSNLLEFWLGRIIDFKLINNGRLYAGIDPEPDVQIIFEAGAVFFLAATAEDFSHHEIQLLAPNGCLRYQHGGGKITWQSAVPVRSLNGYSVLSQEENLIGSRSQNLQWSVVDNLNAVLLGASTYLCTGEQAMQTLESLLRIKAAL